MSNVQELAERILEIEEGIAKEYPNGKMRCPVHLSSGQELIAAGVCMALNVKDTVVSSHRSHAHYIAKGGDVERMLDEIRGLPTGCSGGVGGSMHLIDESVNFIGSTAIVGGTIPVGVGLAFSFKLKEENRISCIFFGDAAIEEGVFYESANFAVLKRLPVLFICENNGYSVLTKLQQRQPNKRPIWKVAKSIGMRAQLADERDAYAVTQRAIDRIRGGNGPEFIEFKTRRTREHCGVGPASREDKK